jgi:hypothetical protein
LGGTGRARAATRGRPQAAEGTPEQVHLTWGGDPARSVVVSWASPGPAVRPRVRIGQRVIAAHPRSYTDTRTGEVVWTYHAFVDELRPAATYGYAVTADNDGNAADPFSATFTTAPDGRAAFRFTSFGDLAALHPAGGGAYEQDAQDGQDGQDAQDGLYGQAAYAIGAVEAFQPLFHLQNGTLADPGAIPAAHPPVPRTVPAQTVAAQTVATKTVPAQTVAAPTVAAPTVPAPTVPGTTVPAPTMPAATMPAAMGPAATGPAATGAAATGPAATGPARPQAWRDLANSTQASAANRPWMPVATSHQLEFGNGEQGLAAYLTRYTLPGNGVPGMEGLWYAFRVGTVLFVSLSGDDVAYAGAGAFVSGPPPLRPAAAGPVAVPAGAGTETGAPAVPAGTSRYVRGYSGGTQTRWLEATLAGARGDASIDWIVVQLHQSACCSADSGNGSDLGIRMEWLPLFDRYEVDLVLSGHDHGYERSFPVRGFDAEAGTDALTGMPVDTRRPRPVTTVDSGVFDTSQGTVHLVLGCGGGAASHAPRAALGFIPWAHSIPRADSIPWADSGKPGTAPVFTRPGRPVPGGSEGEYLRPAADAVEAATWSARRDTASGFGIAVFDVHPGTDAGGQTSITARYYHAADTGRAQPAADSPGGPAGDYWLFETFTLVRPRSDGRRWYRKR